MPTKKEEKQMKYVVVVGDGMADYPIPELGNKTPLQAAHKPNMDKIAAKGRNGLLKTVPNSLNPGSDVAILSVLGFSPKQYYTGRGAFEAAARGIQLEDNDVAFRCNLITEKNGVLADYSAGHITSKDSTQLIEAVKKACEKRDISINLIEEYIDELERDLKEIGEKEIPSSQIGQRLMEKLHEIDDVAYVRFASVYREFKDVNDFFSELKSLLSNQ